MALAEKKVNSAFRPSPSISPSDLKDSNWSLAAMMRNGIGRLFLLGADVEGLVQQCVQVFPLFPVPSSCNGG